MVNCQSSFLGDGDFRSRFDESIFGASNGAEVPPMKCFAMSVVLLCAVTAPGVAQDLGDAPDHGVARISLLSGDVMVRRGDSGEEIAAELNAPLVSRDHVLTNAASRAEIQLDWANIIRLAPESEVRIAGLADRDFRVQLAAGTITYRVLRGSDAQVEISTPTASIHPKEKGTYRIEVRQDYSTEITVRSGEVDVFIGRDFSPLRSGEALLVRGDPSNPERTSIAAIPRDEWDRWNESRDRDLERSESYKYVSRDVYGVDDLDRHGRWVYDPPYGWVWAPTVGVTWAPYRVGRWYWVDYYGWTWLSSDPWGWAPYHYGRWYQAPRYGWVWYPGPIGPRHYWRPALVSFFGWGINTGGFSFGFGFGNVGWVPLAPYEVYRPWYGRNVTVVNIVNNTNVVNVYRNARFIDGRSGVTSVAAGDFGRRRVNQNDFVRANGRDLNRVGDVRGRLPVEPSAESRRPSERAAAPRNNSGADARPAERVFVTRPEPERREAAVQPQTSRERAVQPTFETRREPARDVGVRPSPSPQRSVQAPQSSAARETRALSPNVQSALGREQARNRPSDVPSSNNRILDRAIGPSRRPERAEPAPRAPTERPGVPQNESRSIRQNAPATQSRNPEAENRAARTSNKENPGRSRERR